jgi:hypothetical protein
VASFDPTGFTLNKFSNALVITALAIGILLTGCQIMYSSDTIKIVSQYEEFDAATHNFKNKYHCLPGDCASNNFTIRGNGDGKIGVCNTLASCRNYTKNAPEHIDYWHHLSAAGLITEQIYPSFKYGGGSSAGFATPYAPISTPFKSFPNGERGWTIQSEAVFKPDAGGGEWNTHFFTLSTDGANVFSGTAIFHPYDIYQIDAKVDDGLPLTGKARSWSSASSDSDGKQSLGHTVSPYYDSAKKQDSTKDQFSNVGPSEEWDRICVVNDTTPYTYNQHDSCGRNSPRGKGCCSIAMQSTF